MCLRKDRRQSTTRWEAESAQRPEERKVVIGLAVRRAVKERERQLEGEMQFVKKH
jgi:hypothetical protein